MAPPSARDPRPFPRSRPQAGSTRPTGRPPDERAVPGVDAVIRKVLACGGERGISLLFQGNAVRVGATHSPG